MKVGYFGKSKEVKDCSFMLGNKKGSYFLYNLSSRYAGLFCYINDKMYKIIDEIKVNKRIDRIDNKINVVDVYRKGLRESFFMPYFSNSLLYELSEKEEVELILDVKESYDNRAMGRVYSIEKFDKPERKKWLRK